MTAAAPVWLFDGVCALCSNSVRHVLRHERHHEMRFIAIQSEAGRAMARQYGIDPDLPNSFLFIENGKALFKSDGVLALLQHISGPARLLSIGAYLPKPLRDWIYDCVARNRYRLFGKHQTCMMPDQDTRHRFVLPERAQS